MARNRIDPTMKPLYEIFRGVGCARVTHTYPGRFESIDEEGLKYKVEEPAYIKFDARDEKEVERLAGAILSETMHLPPEASVEIKKRYYRVPEQLAITHEEWELEITPYKGNLTATTEAKKEALKKAVDTIVNTVRRYIAERDL